MKPVYATRWRNLGAIASVLAASSLTTFAISSPAQAVSLIPTSECEINVGLPLLDAGKGCNPSSLLFTVTSNVDITTGTRSRLFVDDPSTENTYGSLQFEERDLGTNPPVGEFWLRPVAVDRNGSLPENGQLEVGTFTLTFNQVVNKLDVDLFDVESENTTTIAINGQPVSYTAPNGGNNSLVSQTFDNVRSITLKLGSQGAGFFTGDGVSIRGLASIETTTVPEPGMTLGVGAVMGMAWLRWRKRQKAV